MENKKWYDWSISKDMWQVVRPFIKMVQEKSDGTLFNYSIAECYDRLNLSLYLTPVDYIKWDTTLRKIGDVLDELSQGKIA